MKKGNNIKISARFLGILLVVIFSYEFLKLCFFEQVSIAIVLGIVGGLALIVIILRDSDMK